jgi:hypothetical protein
MDIDAAKTRIGPAAPPIQGLWRIGDERHFGTLQWRDGLPRLILTLDGNDRSPLTTRRSSSSPGKGATLHTAQTLVAGLGYVVTEGCHRTRVWQVLGDNALEPRHVELIPDRIWTSETAFYADDKITHVVFQDDRLGGLFSEDGFHISHLGEDGSLTGDGASLLSRLTMSYVGASSAQAQTKDDLGITTSMNAQGMWSGTRLDLRSTLVVEVRPSASADAGAAWSLLRRAEEFFSLFLLQSFRFKGFLVFRGDNPSRLAWQDGRDEPDFRLPMPHQALFKIADSRSLANALARWFDCTGDKSIAHWLFCRALSETSGGAARFVAIAQAFEVYGRTLKLSQPAPKEALKRALDGIKSCLACTGLPESYVERVMNMIRSSNKASFQDVMRELIRQATMGNLMVNDAEITTFCRRVSKLRNDLVHVNGADKASLSNAQLEASIVGRKLTFWSAVLATRNLGLRPADMGTMMRNNRFARMGKVDDLAETLAEGR